MVGLILGPAKPKTISYFFAKHTSLLSKRKYWLFRNQDNVSEWSDIWRWVSTM